LWHHSIPPYFAPPQPDFTSASTLTISPIYKFMSLLFDPTEIKKSTSSMAALGRYIYNMFGAGSSDVDDRPEGSNSFIVEEQFDKTWTPCDADRYKPSIEDVLSVKEMFLKNRLLPPELVDPVIDFAEYWPHTTSARKERITVRAGAEDRENQFIVHWSSAPSHGIVADR